MAAEVFVEGAIAIDVDVAVELDDLEGDTMLVDHAARSLAGDEHEVERDRSAPRREGALQVDGLRFARRPFRGGEDFVRALRRDAVARGATAPGEQRQREEDARAR